MITSSDLSLFQPEYVPTNDTDPVGGALSSTELSSSVGNLFPTMVYEDSGGNAVVWYYKVFMKNKNSTKTLSDVSYWVSNLLTSNSTASVLSVVSSSESDSGSYKCRFYFYDVAGSAESYEDITMNGTSPVTGLKTVKANTLHKVEFLSSNGNLANANGNISITCGSLLGYIPAGCDFATTEVAFALETDGQATPAVAVDQIWSAVNRLTSPTKITAWSAAKSAAEAVSGANIPPSSAQGLWLRVTGSPGTLPTAQNRLRICIAGTSPA